MEIIALQSGSSGNSVYLESDGIRLLFDAGISGRQAETRLADHGKDIRSIDALIISHDHRDHIACMGVYQRKFGLPIYITRRTLLTVRRRTDVGKLSDVQFFQSGDTLQFGHVSVETMSTPHDAADGVVFVVDDHRHRFGILTDLGHVFTELEQVITTLDAVLVESNYDPDMLEHGSYPRFLKERIRGPRGHLSNVEAAQLLSHTSAAKLKWACLAHLSEENNNHDVAIKTHQRILGNQFPLRCADRYTSTDVLTLSDSTA